ncbi:hypothetical protein [Flavobacterium sp. XS2P39]|uniref:hypothetical protein n=1 Tax=Flavobacterium sp. XS2P39 TaxID=3401725 RepID=UPI003AAB7B64
MKDKKREGLWIELYSQDSSHYKSVGTYRKGNPIKKWSYYLNNKIIKREKYKRNICVTTFYHENGKIQSKGKTKVESSDLNIHWYYFGDWNFFDAEGKLINIIKYNNGESVSETETK